jgi:hypothetical protein
MKLWISMILLGIVLYFIFKFVNFEPCTSCNESIPTMTNVGDDGGDSDEEGEESDSDDDSDEENDDDMEKI